MAIVIHITGKCCVLHAVVVNTCMLWFLQCIVYSCVQSCMLAVPTLQTKFKMMIVSILKHICVHQNAFYCPGFMCIEVGRWVGWLAGFNNNN